MPTVAISDDFLEALERLPRKVQRKVRTFVTKFRENPTAASINYEKISAADPRVHTVRVGIDYRGIVLHPDEGDVYLLTYIGHHDEAMDWAKRKQFSIHARTGALQVMSVSAEAEAAAAISSSQAPGPKGIFSDYSEDQLFDLGVPENLVSLIATIQSEAQLDAIAPLLPAEANEALYGLACGMSYADVTKEIERKLIAPGDLTSALQHPDTLRRLTVVDNDASLQAMLDAPLAKWRVFLHPSQRKLVRRSFNGPAKVTGGAGTGKTVVAMHRAAYLANEVHTDPNDRILFTTFTKNLAQVVAGQLKQLDEGAAGRIAVRNLHSVAHEVLRQSGMQPRPLSDEQAILRQWEDAISDAEPPPELRDPAFYRAEYDDVVLAQGLTELEDYLRARRTGRKGRLSRPQREPVWRVMMRFADLCMQSGELTYPMMVGKAAEYLTHHRPLPYRALVVDESQDLTAADWRFIRSLVPEGSNDLFLVGDAHQRIYGTPVVLSRCGVNVRGRSSRLRVNYRTTQEIRRWACGILEGLSFDDLDGEGDSHDGYTSLLNGPKPELHSCTSLDQQIDHAAAHISTLLASGLRDHAICATAPNHRICNQIASGLRERGITPLILDANIPTDQDPGIRIATMHRIKGLEFNHVLIFNADLTPTDDDPRTRCLYHVAATRARDGLVVYAANT